MNEMNDMGAQSDIQLSQQIVQVGRQPILDRRLNLYGYELLYRSSIDDLATIDGSTATARTVLDSFLEFGLQRLAGPHRVFINMTGCFFSEMQPLPIDRDRLVIEVLEEIELTQEVIAGVRKLHEAGYTIAIDDYRFESRWEPLLPYCSIVKVDILDLQLESYLEQIEHLKSLGLILLAEKVETATEYELTMRLGFDLFQGYFFSKPQTITTRRSQRNKKLLLNMIAKINDPNASIEEIAALVELDPNISLKMLRFINSASNGMPRIVKSLREAVVYIGFNRLRAWATLFVMANFDLTTPELITTSLLRAELCRSLAEEFATGHPESGYTVGLLSTLDAILNLPMNELLSDLPLPQTMLDALSSHSGPYGSSLKCAIDLEHYDWLTGNASAIPVAILTSIYVRALTRVEEIRNSL